MGIHIVEDITFLRGLLCRLAPMPAQPQEGDHHLCQLIGGIQLLQGVAVRPGGFLPQLLEQQPQGLRLLGRALYHRCGGHVLHQVQRRMAGLPQRLHRHVYVVKVVGQQVVLQRLRYLHHVGDLPGQHRYHRAGANFILPVLQRDRAASAGEQPESGHLVDQRRGRRVNGLHRYPADLTVICLRAV